MTKIQEGIKPKDRKLATPRSGKKLTANQWQNTPQQNLFMQLWLDPSSTTFSNVYQSALASGYSEHYARILTSGSTGNKWISEYLNDTNMDTKHIKNAIQDIYLNPKAYNNAKSPADTRLKALELLAKITGILDNKQVTNVTLVQPILGGASHKPQGRVTVVNDSKEIE